MTKTSYRFKLEEGEAILSAEKVVLKHKTIEGYMVTKMLKMMEQEGRLPAGYFTRVMNGKVKIETVRAYLKKVIDKSGFNYRMSAKPDKTEPGAYMVALIYKI